MMADRVTPAAQRHRGRAPRFAPMLVAVAMVAFVAAAPQSRGVSTGTSERRVSQVDVVDPLPSADAELHRSDHFWDPVQHYGNFGLVYDSLDEITRDVHLVVRGRIAEVKLGQFETFEGDFEPIPILIGVVVVDEVIKGELKSRVPGRIEVSLDPPWRDWEDHLLPNIPRHDHLFFLMNDEQQRAEFGYEARDPANSPYLYWRPNGYQAVLRNIEGRIAIIEPEFAEFPVLLDGTPFDAVLQDVRLSAELAEAVD